MLSRLAACLILVFCPICLSAKEPSRFWSLRPLVRPSVPSVSSSTPIRNPIDAFILAKLREKGLSPTREADRRTLLRRLYLDLTGLPPTLEQLTAFLNDSRPDAYERVVDQLLGSPAYGERWARHWMDTVHFSETHGHDQDRVRPSAWPYRDYLITAFNEDRGFKRFVEEQIAGDVLFPDKADRLPALGFLSAGPWDESSLRDIREDSIDRKIGHYLDRDDMLSTVMITFNSMTVHCARCHDHKFDPISQEDYYNLQAVFAGVGRGERSYDVDPGIAQRRRQLAVQLAELKKNPASASTHLTASLKEEIARWEKTRTHPVAWSVLHPETVRSEHGSTLTQQADDSILASGKKPPQDVYTVTASLQPRTVTALRLELLTDPSLPHRGPGRQDNGNLHLNEIRLLVAPKSAPEKSRPLAIASATANFDQQGWTVLHAFDGQPRTAWGIYPQVGKPHQAIFELREGVKLTEESLLTVVLEQTHGGSHLIGRFRLAVTDAPRPVRISNFPDTVNRALAVPKSARTPADHQQIAAHYLSLKWADELQRLPAPQMVYSAGRDFKVDGSHRPISTPRMVHVLKRGDIHQPGREAKPAALSLLPEHPGVFTLSNPADEGQRRAALAKWISDPKNPLTWRSIVNRVWHYHFGRGIVETPGDLGIMGGRPTHPELLDWLAVEFRDSGGSLKRLHRLILTSATYRQASTHHVENARKDADNRYLWRMNRTRLDAEAVRDAILQISDRLDRRMGGPSDQQFAMRPGIHVTPIVEYDKFTWNRPTGHRRSVYRFQFRTLPDPFVDCLDGPDGSQLTPVRNTSITPLQALALLNNPFVLAHSKTLAENLKATHSSPAEQIDRLCLSLWGRTPQSEERKEFEDYAKRHGLANLCRVLFNSNEFLFVP